MESINERMTDTGVCRAAPATLGLLKTEFWSVKATYSNQWGELALG